MTHTEIQQRANSIGGELFSLLKQQNRQLVLAESCTGGLISAILTQFPGISNWLCGSAVVYQDNTKVEWLHIDPTQIEEFTSVSQQVTEKLAMAVLEQTCGAEFALAITGHLEPGASERGTHAFVALAVRRGQLVKCFASVQHPLLADSRVERQWEAACHALTDAVAALQKPVDK